MFTKYSSRKEYVCFASSNSLSTPEYTVSIEEERRGEERRERRERRERSEGEKVRGRGGEEKESRRSGENCHTMLNYDSFCIF